MEQPKRTRGTAILAALLTVVALTGCATNTMTGRSQLQLVSEDSAAKQSRSYYSAMVSEYGKKSKVLASGPQVERVKTITNRLIAQAVKYRPEARDWDWQVTVIDEPGTVNAFCMPGGLMGIYTGFFNKLAATDDEIAQVMGHEIGHALAGHGAEKMSVQLASSMVVLAVSAATSKDSNDFRAAHTGLTLAALAFVNLPNGRQTEYEADRFGIELAARAGYHPDAAVSLWDKMGRLSGGGGPEFLRTHPTSDNRKATLGELRNPMMQIYAKATNDPATAQAYDWLGASKAGRPSADPSRALALYSPRWEAFTEGRFELQGGNVPGLLVKQGALRSKHDSGLWRDLAQDVMDLGFKLDLAYFYMGRAAQGLGFEEASKRYMRTALELSATAEGSCAKRSFLSCSGFDVASEAARQLATSGRGAATANAAAGLSPSPTPSAAPGSPSADARPQP